MVNKNYLKNCDEICLMTDGIIKDRSHEKGEALKSGGTTQNMLVEAERKIKY